MTIPSRVTVGPFDFEVIQSAGHALVSNERGTTDLVRMTITLDTSYSEQHRQKVLLHEVLHAIAFVTGPGEVNEHISEEAWIQKTAAMLLDTLRRNPDVLAYLLAS